MVNYEDSIIYKLINNHTGEVLYKASKVSKKICHRFYYHKNSKNELDKRIFEHNNVDIKLIERYPCDNKEELNKRLNYYIVNNECLNEIKEPKKAIDHYYKYKESYIRYREKTKDKMKEFKKIYNKDKRDFINEKFICDCGGKYTRNGKSQHQKTKKHIKYIESLNN